MRIRQQWQTLDFFSAPNVWVRYVHRQLDLLLGAKIAQEEKRSPQNSPPSLMGERIDFTAELNIRERGTQTNPMDTPLEIQNDSS
jgi:hypothetical protein